MPAVIEPNADPATYALAYDLGRAAVAEQATSLKAARDRAGTLMTTAAAIATIAIGLAFRGSNVDLDGWGVLGVALGALGFLAVTAATVAIWQPVEMTVSMNSGVIVSSFAERPGDPMTLGEMHSELALWLGKFTVTNVEAIQKRLKWSRGALSASPPRQEVSRPC